MESTPFLSNLADYLPEYLDSKPDFKTWLRSQNGASMLNEMADFLVLTMPSPRIDYYQSSDYAKI